MDNNKKDENPLLPSGQTLSELQKKECEVLLEEYKRLNNEISKRLDYCDKNISYQFVLLGIVVTAITAIFTKKEVDFIQNLPLVLYILLVSPIVFYVLSYYYSINNMFILKIGQYITTHIKSRVSELLNSDKVLTYDSYFQTEVLYNSKEANKLVSLIVLQWTLSIPILLLIAFLILKISYYSDGPMLDLQLLLLVVNVIFIFITANVNSTQRKIIKTAV